MRIVVTAILLSLLVATPLSATVGSASTTDEDAIVGTWLTPNGNSHVEISKCGESYCGRVTWLSSGNTDRLGLMILEGFTFDGDTEWKDGTITNPADGKSRKAKLELDEDGRILKVRVSAGLRGRTVKWVRVTDAGR